MMVDRNKIEFAKEADRQDPLSHFRNRFHIPQHNGRDCIYLIGNSLGLQPKTVREYINQELDDSAESTIIPASILISNPLRTLRIKQGLMPVLTLHMSPAMWK